MKLSNMKNGEYLYSPTTEIIYTRKSGVVMKFPLYLSPAPNRVWDESRYTLDGNHFVKPSKQTMSTLRKYETMKFNRKRR